MPGAHILASNKANTDRAGLTRTPEEQTSQEQTAPPTVQEITHGDLNIGSLFAGGIHPESIVQTLGHANTELERGTDSVLGHLGGLVPRRGSVVAPGPAGGAAAAQTILGLPGRIAAALKKG